MIAPGQYRLTKRLRRDVRRRGRALALRDALRAISSCEPSLPIDDHPEMADAYQGQLRLMCEWFAKSHRAKVMWEMPLGDALLTAEPISRPVRAGACAHEDGPQVEERGAVAAAE